MASAMVLLLLSSTSAWSADLTEIAPWLRGDVDIRYAYDNEAARLVEGDTVVGKRTITDNTLTFAGNFTVGPGIAVAFELPYYAGTTVGYTDATAMVIDPNSDSGTMLGTSALDPQPGATGSGLGGPSLMLRGTPFSETLFKNRGDDVTWLFEAGYRFGDKTNFYALDESGTARGGGPGGAALLLRSAFSTTIRWSQPYIQGSLVVPGHVAVDIRDTDGTVLSSAAQVRPGTEARVRAGTEIVAVAREAVGARFAIDLHTEFAYRGWQEVPSGTYLPSILEASRSAVATEGETTSLSAGVGLNYRIMEWVQLNVGGDLGTVMPETVEHYYPVSTDIGTLTWGVHTTLRFRGRDKPERLPWEPKS